MGQQLTTPREVEVKITEAERALERCVGMTEKQKRTAREHLAKAFTAATQAKRQEAAA